MSRAAAALLAALALLLPGGAQGLALLPGTLAPPWAAASQPEREVPGPDGGDAARVLRPLRHLGASLATSAGLGAAVALATFAVLPWDTARLSALLMSRTAVSLVLGAGLAAVSLGSSAVVTWLARADGSSARFGWVYLASVVVNLGFGLLAGATGSFLVALAGWVATGAAEVAVADWVFAPPRSAAAAAPAPAPGVRLVAVAF